MLPFDKISLAAGRQDRGLFALSARFVVLMLLMLPVPQVAADTLQQALDAYWLRQPQAQAMSARLDSAAAGKSQADGVLAGAPTLALSRRDQRDGASRETELEMAWPLSGNRDDRQRQAAATVVATEADASLLRVQLAAELIRIDSERKFRSEQLALATARLQLTEALQRDVSQKVAAGELARADLLTAQTETLAATTVRLGAEQAAEEALSQWQWRTGNSNELIDPVDVPVSTDVDNNPQWQRAKALAQAAAARSHFEQRRSGDIELSLLLRREEDPVLDEQIDSAGLRISVPLFAGAGRSQAVADAEAERLQADAEAKRVLLTLAQEQQQARRYWQRSAEQVALMQQQQQLAEQSLQLAQAAFAAGETTLAERLRVQQRLFDSREALSLQRKQQRDALARLIEAEGVLP
ncbi:TolC family protein [Permianibacter sp. IMCC34836]|uniref:TolC family protein n=1 Tax=Permianibacter fluminis TaxID=2738515 RepID=UPI0015567FEC|nr:TolC family protein [Permianibacter fluminis]NQD36965.1 TolC family protein [Permianibacter fluminis]